jgi:hypothetical protein
MSAPIIDRHGETVCPTCGDVNPTPCGSPCPLYQRRYQHMRYWRLRDAERCVQCGDAGVTPPHVRCTACLAYHRAYWAVRHASP